MHRSRTRLITLCAVLAVAGGCGPRSSQTGTAIQIKGSDTMVNLVQALAEEFMARHPDMSVAVTGGGSGTGIAALISGTCDLTASSRKMKKEEIELASARGAAPQEIVAALDGLAVVVHPDNPVRRLTIPQLAQIYTAEVTDWSALGGPNAEIVLLSREVNSGTHVYFKEHVLGTGPAGRQREFSPRALLLPSSQAIADEVAGNPAAIGYYGMGYLNPQNVAVPIAASDAGPFLKPSEDAVRSGAYPISRPLFFYTRGEPTGVTADFLAFALSPEGQAVVKAVDFVPIETAAP